MTRRAIEILARLPEGPVTGAEIGVFRGQTAKTLLGRDSLFLWMVDNWRPFSVLEGEGFSQSAQNQNYEQALAETEFAADRRKVIVANSLDAAVLVNDGSLDFVFIDANHYTPHVDNDIRAWFPKLRPGGILCGHDYANNEYSFGSDVRHAVDGFAASIGKPVQTGADFTWFIFL